MLTCQFVFHCPFVSILLYTFKSRVLNNAYSFTFYCYYVVYLDRIIPHHRNVTVGQTTYFSCFSEKTASWQFRGGPLPGNAIQQRVEKSREYKLTIKDIHTNNAGNYTCSGEDSDSVIFQDEAVLVVTGKNRNVQ